MLGTRTVDLWLPQTVVTEPVKLVSSFIKYEVAAMFILSNYEQNLSQIPKIWLAGFCRAVLPVSHRDASKGIRYCVVSLAPRVSSSVQLVS